MAPWKHKQTGEDCCSTPFSIASMKGCQRAGARTWNAVVHCRTASTVDDPVDAAAEEQPDLAKPKAKRNRKKEPKPGHCSLPPASLERQYQQCILLCSCIAAQEALERS